MSVENILAVYRQATDAERQAGRIWYSEALHLAVSLAGHPGPALLSTDSAAGIIAALSPLTPWNRNKELAIRAVSEGEASGTLGNSVRAANRILSGEHPLDVLKADKVRNFYLSILGSKTAVCIDRHAWEVYAGKVYTNKTRPDINKSRYREASDAYREAATHLLDRTTPTQLQATTWLTWRRLKGIKP